MREALARVAIKMAKWTDRRACLALAACLVIFGFLRLFAAFGDFYVDEIWSFYFARQLNSPFDVFSLNHDNNHILNTLYLYVVGGKPFFFSGKPTFIPHRFLSIITGTISVWLIWKIALRKGRLEAFTAILLAGLSYPLILYSSEARGYGPLIMFALASFVLAERYIAGRGLATAALFWGAVVLAFLSHSSYIFIYAALFIWSAAEEIKSGGIVRALRRVALLHCVPAAFLTVYYLVFLKGMVYGGGEMVEPLKVVISAASMAVGLPSEGAFGYIPLAAVLVLLAVGLAFLRRTAPVQSVFFLCAIFVIPALATVTLKPEFLYFRYFLVCFPFFYLLAAYALAGVYRRPGWGKPVFFAAMIVFSVFNVRASLDLIRYGRGAYSEAVAYMISESPGPEVIVGSDHDFRNELVLGFYSGFFKEKRISYLDKEARQDTVPDWFLEHSVDRARRPSEYLFEGGYRFTLKQNYGFAGVSGWSWFVYKKNIE
jgi:hypothetical protein